MKKGYICHHEATWNIKKKVMDYDTVWEKPPEGATGCRKIKIKEREAKEPESNHLKRITIITGIAFLIGCFCLYFLNNNHMSLMEIERLIKNIATITLLGGISAIILGTLAMVGGFESTPATNNTTIGDVIGWIGIMMMLGGLGLMFFSAVLIQI